MLLSVVIRPSHASERWCSAMSNSQSSRQASRSGSDRCAPAPRRSGSGPTPTRSGLGSCDPAQTVAARAHLACSGGDRRMQVLAQLTLEVQRIVDRVMFDLWIELVDLGLAEAALRKMQELSP